MLSIFLGLVALQVTTALPSVQNKFTLPTLPTTLLGVDTTKDPLTFDRDGKFKVLSLSDMHMGERWGDQTYADWGDTNDAKTQQVHATILDKELPNFVVFGGDLVTGENLFKENATKYLDRVFSPTSERKIPFSSIHGNHDNAINITHEIEIGYETSNYPLSYTRSDVGPKPYGGGNYWIPVYATKPISKKSIWERTRPALLMWFLDSRSFVSGHGDGPGPVPPEADYYWVDENTVPRYIDSQVRLMKQYWGSIPPSLVFVHIPFQKVKQLFYLPSAGNHDDEPGIDTQGNYQNEYTGLDSTTWTEIVKLDEGLGKVLAVTSGHDHGESWCARSANSTGITICFDGHSGYGGYTTTNSHVRNGRVFSLNLNDLRVPKAQTWNSFEDGTTNDEVTLSQDYMKEYV